MAQLALLGMCLILWVHSPTLILRTDEFLKADEWDGMRFLHALISNGLARVALPFFFAVSGNRFFHGAAGRPVADWYWPKLRRRLKSLGIPYLFWVGGFLIAIDGARALAGYLHLSAGMVLHRLFVEPVPVPLWYLREILIYAALAPLFYLAIRYAGPVWLLLLTVFWCIDPDPARTVLVSRGLLFFSAGAYIAIHDVHVDATLLRRWGPALAATWITLRLVKAGLYAAHDPQAPDVPAGVLHCVSVMIGVLAVWACYDRAPQGFKRLLARLSPYTFFIFAVHLSIIGAITRIFWRYAGEPTPLADLCLYLACPFATLAITVAAGYVVRRYTPRVYALSTGWR